MNPKADPPASWYNIASQFWQIQPKKSLNIGHNSSKRRNHIFLLARRELLKPTLKLPFGPNFVEVVLGRSNSLEHGTITRNSHRCHMDSHLPRPLKVVKKSDLPWQSQKNPQNCRICRFSALAAVRAQPPHLWLPRSFGFEMRPPNTPHPVLVASCVWHGDPRRDQEH